MVRVEDQKLEPIPDALQPWASSALRVPYGEHFDRLVADAEVHVVPRPKEKRAANARHALAPRGCSERGHERNDCEHALKLSEEEIG